MTKIQQSTDGHLRHVRFTHVQYPGAAVNYYFAGKMSLLQDSATAKKPYYFYAGIGG